MNRQIKETKIVFNHVVSEPGDATRYDFYVHQRNDDFFFMQGESTFAFPGKLNYYETFHIDDVQKANKFCQTRQSLFIVNPNTLLECVNTIKELYNEDN